MGSHKIKNLICQYRLTISPSVYLKTLLLDLGCGILKSYVSCCRPGKSREGPIQVHSTVCEYSHFPEYDLNCKSVYV